MSTLDPTFESSVVGEASADERSEQTLPVVGVLTTSDHKVLGMTMIGGSLLGLLAVTAVAFLLGIERVNGDPADDLLLDAGAITQLFVAYRVGLVEAVVLPLLVGISLFVVPLQLGARSLAFPRAAAVGVWTWLGGIVLVTIALANNGGPAGGNEDYVDLYLAGNVLVLIGLTAVAATIATSVLTTRAPGMRLHRVPLFSWAALIGSLGLVVVLPVAAGTHIYLLVDFQYTQTAFGGTSDIWAWTQFLYSGPAVGLYAVMAVGFAAELLAVVFRQRLPLRWIAMIGVGLVGTAAFAGAGQQEMVTLPGTGTEVKAANIGTKFAFLANWALLTLLPVLGVVIVMGIGALAAKPYKGLGGAQGSRLGGAQGSRPGGVQRSRVGGAQRSQGAGQRVRPNLIAPFVFGFFGVGLVLVGMLAAATNGIEDIGLAFTVFEEGATVAVVYGAVLAGLGAAAYWFPKASGRKLPELPLYGLALLGAGGAALASIPYLIAGFADQPGYSVVWENDGPGELLNVGVTAGHAAVALTALAFAGLAAKTWRTSDHAGINPWQAHTLEWTTTSPAPPGNFEVTPTVMSPEPVLDLVAKPDFAESDRSEGAA